MPNFNKQDYNNSRNWSIPLAYSMNRPELRAYRHGPILGGIGTGWISFNGSGLINSRMYNMLKMEGGRPGSFFAIRTASKTGTTVRILQDYLHLGSVEGRGLLHYGQKMVERTDCRSFPPAIEIDYYDKKLPCDVSVTAFSPVVPDEYILSSFPIAVFIFKIKNTTKETIDTTLLFSFQNDIGFWDFGNHESCTAEKVSTDSFHGISMTNRSKNLKKEHRGEIIIAADSAAGKVSTIPEWTVTGNGKELFVPFIVEGDVRDDWKNPDMAYFNESLGKLIEMQQKGNQNYAAKAGAVAVRTTIEPGEEKIIPFFLGWYFPMQSFKDVGCQIGKVIKGEIVQFDQDGWYHQYTRHVGKPVELIEKGIEDYKTWWESINSWHQKILSMNLPDWILIKYVHELTYLFGWSHWVYKDKNDYFIIVEGQFSDCPSTNDVDGYNWFVLLWPKLEIQESTEIRDGQHNDGKIPHDLKIATPPNQGHQEPWFIIRCYQNYVFSRDHQYLEKSWPAIKRAFQYQLDTCIDKTASLLTVDHNGSGGYDSWNCDGFPAYVNSQWLLELKILSKLAYHFNDNNMKQDCDSLFEKAQKNYIDYLWVDHDKAYPYFRLCSGDVYDRDCCQTEELIGVFYGNLFGESILSDHYIAKTLNTIYEKLYIHEYGWLCGRYIDGRIPVSDPNVKASKIMQSARVRPIAQWQLASLLIQIGRVQEGLKTAEWIYKEETSQDYTNLWTYPYYTAAFDNSGNFKKYFDFCYPSYPRTGFLPFLLSCAGTEATIDGILFRPLVPFPPDHTYLFKWGKGWIRINIQNQINQISKAYVNGTPMAFDRSKGIMIPGKMENLEKIEIVLK
jgi:non-lysosomal glucosylceramidase